MADAFEAELEALVSKVARELAHDITRVILRRLGIDGTVRFARNDKRLSAGAVSSALRQAAGKSRPRHPTPPRSRAKSGPVSRPRPSVEQRAAAFEKVAQVVEAGSGLSVGEIERQSGVSRSVVIAALKALKEQGRVFMGGTKRFARYALSQSAADKASSEARGLATE
jgi:ribosomal protein S25